MAANPYELRWEVLTRAEDLLRTRFDSEVTAWEAKKKQELTQKPIHLFQQTMKFMLLQSA